MEGVCADNMVAILLRIRNVEVVKHILGAFPVQSQLFAPFEYGLKIRVQLVFGFTQGRHMFVHPRHQHKTAPDGDRHPDSRYQQHFARQHPQIRRGTDSENDPLHQFRQTHKSNGDIAHIAG